MGIVARPLGEGASTVEDFTDSLLNLIEAARYLGFVVKDFMMEDPKETTLDGSPALETIATVTYMDWGLKVKAVTTVKDGIGYLIGVRGGCRDVRRTAGHGPTGHRLLYYRVELNSSAFGLGRRGLGVLFAIPQRQDEHNQH